MFLEIFPLYNLQKTRSSKTRIEKKEIEWGYREDRRTDAEGTNGITSRQHEDCLLYTSPSPRDKRQSRMPSSA